MATFNERLARAFIEAGHDVTIFTFSLQYPEFLFPGKTQLSDEAPPDDLDIRIKVNSINPFNWLKVGKELKKLKPDILVVRYWLPFMAPCLGTISSIVRRNSHTKIVAIADNVIPHEKRTGDKLLTAYFIKKVDGFITMSETVRSDLKKFNVRDDIIRFCEHPLYDNFGKIISKQKAKEFLKLDTGKPLVLFFGFIRDYKGLDILLEAMNSKALRNLGVKLIIAGEFYSSPEKYHRIAEELNLHDHIIWQTEFIPNDMVRFYFCAADIVAQPYKSATQSGVTQIAYHFEVPMLVTNVGGLPEMVPNDQVGYVVEPEPQAIRNSLISFFTKNESERMIENIKIHKKRFSWEALVNKIMESHI